MKTSISTMIELIMVIGVGTRSVMRISRITSIQMAVLFVALSTLYAENGNLIQNGSFESPLEDQFVIRTSKTIIPAKKTEKAEKEEVSWGIDNSARTGAKSLKFVSNIVNGNGELNYKEKIPVHVGKRYTFSASYYLESAAPESLRVSGRVMYFDDQDKVIGYNFPEAPAKTGKWLPFKVDFYPPVETVTVYLTLWYSGKGSISWDDMEFKEAPLEKNKNAYSYHFRLLDTDDFALWKEMPNAKIPAKGVPDDLAGGKAEITCARNESEPFLMVFSPKRDVKAMSLAFSDLTAGNGAVLPAANISYSRIGFIDIKESDNPSLVGKNADPMFPDQIFDLTAHENTPLWISVNVPFDALPGAYAGSIRILQSGKKIASVPLSLKVRSFAIPTIPRLRALFYGRSYPKQMGQFDKRPLDEITDDIFSTLKRHRITGNQAYWVPLPTYEMKQGVLTITDWSPFDSFVSEKMGKYNMRWFLPVNLGFYGANDGWGFSPNTSNTPHAKVFGFDIMTSEGKAALTQYVRQLGAHLRSKGWYDLCHSYVWDEPPDTFLKTVAELCDAMHAGDPELDVFVTRKITPELIGKINTWCLPFAPGYVDEEKIRERLFRGDKMYIYNWRICLDEYNYIQNRLYPWLAYMIDAEGALLWQILQTSFKEEGVNPWTEMNRTYGNGAATLLYPSLSGKGPYVSSQRFALVKEGIDDFDYFKVLEEKIEAVCKGWGKARVKEIISALVHEPPFTFKNDSSLLYHLRDMLAEEIEEVDVKPQLLIKTSPPDNARTVTSVVLVNGICDPGAKISINDEEPFIAGNGWFSRELSLKNIGLNTVSIKVAGDGHEKTIYRSFTFERDPQLVVFRRLLEKGKACGVDVKEYSAVYEKITGENGYPENSKVEIEKAVSECRKKILSKMFDKREPNPANQVYSALFKRAEWALNNGFYDKAEHYLEEARKLNPNTGFSDWSCKIEAVNLKNHFGFTLGNSLIEAVILESGARILDFKAGKVSCLRQGNLDEDFPENMRADISECEKKMLLNFKPSLGGYENADMAQQPYSYADWKLSIVTLRPDEISIVGEVVMPNRKFLLKRTMTMKKDDPRLQIRYDITNLYPEGFKSDDPHAYDFPWRAHVDIGIGNDASGGGNPEGDILVIPTEMKLPCEKFSKDNGTFFEIRTLPLADNYAAAFDPLEKTGFVQILDPLINNLYVWFHSGESKYGSNKVYTIEPNVAIGVKPFIIAPGQTLSFTNYLAGFGNITSKEELLKSINSY